MDGLDRSVAGMTCREVLADLSDFIDGELPPSRVAQVREHLAGCGECERFGGRVGRLVGALRADREPETVDPSVAARLRERLGLGPRA